MIHKPQDQNCQNGTYGTQRYKSEAVIPGMLIVTDGCDTNTQRHNKGNGHRSSGHPAGIKGHCQKIFRNEHCNDKNQNIKTE